jgi:hypothetical protein
MKKQNLVTHLSITAIILTVLTGDGQCLAQSKVAAGSSKAMPSTTDGSAAGSAYVSGYIFDNKFQVSKAYYSPRSLTLRGRLTPTGSIVKAEGREGIKINFEDNQQFEGESYKVLADQDLMIAGEERKPRPALELYALVGAKVDRYIDTVANHARYRMTLKFFKRRNGLLPGFIDLEIQDPHVTKIKGYFWAAPE